MCISSIIFYVLDFLSIKLSYQDNIECSHFLILEGNPPVLKLSPRYFTSVVSFNSHEASIRYSHFTKTQRRKLKLAEAPAAGEWVSGCLCGTLQIPQQSLMTWGQL